MKKCTKCGIEKELTEFTKHKSSKGGHRNPCKVCINKQAREHYTNPEVKKKSHEANRRYYQNLSSEEKSRVYQRKKEALKKSPKLRARANEVNKKHQQRPENVKKRRNKKLQKEFGIGQKRFEQMEKEQNGVCGICGFPEYVKRKGSVLPLNVDHCHKTNVVRGLLCHRCNWALGGFRDDIDIMASAISYLQQDYSRQAG